MPATLKLPETVCEPLDQIPQECPEREPPVDKALIEESVRTILRAVGEDPNRPGLVDTPRRVAKMYVEMFSGLHRDPSKYLKVVFPEKYDEMVRINCSPRSLAWVSG